MYRLIDYHKQYEEWENYVGITNEKKKIYVDKQFKYYNIIMLKISQCKTYKKTQTDKIE